MLHLHAFRAPVVCMIAYTYRLQANQDAQFFMSYWREHQSRFGISPIIQSETATNAPSWREHQ